MYYKSQKKNPQTYRFTFENHKLSVSRWKNVVFLTFAGCQSVQTINIRLRSQLVPKRVRQLRYN